MSHQVAARLARRILHVISMRVTYYYTHLSLPFNVGAELHVLAERTPCVNNKIVDTGHHMEMHSRLVSSILNRFLICDSSLAASVDVE